MRIRTAVILVAVLAVVAGSVPTAAKGPYSRIVSPGAVQLATMLTQAFNGGLDFAVAQLSALPGIGIVRLDAFGLLDNVVADPAVFGLTTVTTACLSPSTPPFSCRRPDEFLFWDGIHPTAAGHAIVAQEAARVLGR